MELIYKGGISPVVKNHLTNKKANSGNKLKKIKKIVQHGTANYNKGANALANRNYFNRPEVVASTQYVTDDKMTLECMYPDNLANSVGAKTYTAFGNSLKESGYSPNYFTISNEICVNIDGDFSKAVQKSVELSAVLLFATGLKKDDIVRHHDITGKLCPDFYLNDSDFKEFKDRVQYVYSTVFGNQSMPNPIIAEDVLVDTNVLNIRSGPSSDKHSIAGQLKKGDRVTTYELINGFYHIGNNKWIYAPYTKELNEEPTLVYGENEKAIMRVISPIAYIRESNSSSSKIVETIRLGDVVYATEVKADWIKIGSKGWVHGINLESMTFRENVTLSEDRKMYLTPDNNSNSIIIPKGKQLFIYDSFKKDNKDWFNVRFVENLANNIVRFGFTDKK